MNKEARKELAAFSFTEKVKLLEKLRDRSLVLAEARKKLAEQKKPGTRNQRHQQSQEPKAKS